MFAQHFVVSETGGLWHPMENKRLNRDSKLYYIYIYTQYIQLLILIMQYFLSPFTFVCYRSSAVPPWYNHNDWLGTIKAPYRSSAVPPWYNHNGWLGTIKAPYRSSTVPPWYNHNGWLGTKHPTGPLLYHPDIAVMADWAQSTLQVLCSTTLI